MSIALIEDQLQNALALAAGGILIRWPNENWPIGTHLSPDNSPIDASGNPVMFAQAEVIAGPDTADIAPAGMRHSERIGLFRVYLVAPLGSGRAEVNQYADLVAAAFKRFTVYINTFTGQRLTTMDPRIDDHVAERTVQLDVLIDQTVPLASHAARWVRMISIPWRFDYYS